jgi:hypothetical protein
MVLKIKYKRGYHISRGFLSFETKNDIVDIYMGDSRYHTVRDWEEIYIMNQSGETIDTIKR